MDMRFKPSVSARGILTPAFASRALSLLLMLVFSTLIIPAHANDPLTSTNARPRIGLVLGGGGAKGAAHIGVLDVLEELRVPIDCIAGTSMGALVGGTFASGLPVSEIESSTTGIDWSRTVGGAGMRDRMPIERKLEGSTYTNQLELGIKEGKLVLPGGLLKTQDIEDVIRNLIDDARFQRDFDKLPIPFRAIATDMVSGEMVVLGSGDLSVAMRASMAVPGAFSAVVVGDRVLSDGGMVRNLPVDIARELCADVVIAVWLAEPATKAEDLDSALALISRSMSVMIGANERAQIESLTSDDVGIEVQMGDIGTGDFQRVAEAVVLGRAAAKAQADELRRFSVSEAEYLAWRQSITSERAQPVQLAEVRIKGLKQVNEGYVKSHLVNLKPGAEVDSREIKEDTDRLYALGDFERVEQQIITEGDKKIIEISPFEKSWGPNLLRFDLGLDAESSGELVAILRAEYSKTWLGARGGMWNNAFQIGRQMQVFTEYYQPLDVAHKFFVRPAIHYENVLQSVFLEGKQVARYNVRDFYGELSVGANIGTRAQLSTGLRIGRVETQRNIGSPVLPEQPWENDSSIFLNAIYDTRDDIGLPTSGSLAIVRYVHSDSFFGGEQDYDLVEGVWQKAFPWRGDSLSLIVGGGDTLGGQLPTSRDFRLGGIRSFPGLQFDELRGTSYWVVASSYLWKLADIQPLFGKSIYAGLRLQAGNMSGRSELGNHSGTLYGIAGSLNGRTPVGPFILSLGYVDNGSWELQFSFGRPISEGSAFDYIY